MAFPLLHTCQEEGETVDRGDFRRHLDVDINRIGVSGVLEYHRHIGGYQGEAVHGPLKVVEPGRRIRAVVLDEIFPVYPELGYVIERRVEVPAVIDLGRVEQVGLVCRTWPADMPANRSNLPRVRTAIPGVIPGDDIVAERSLVVGEVFDENHALGAEGGNRHQQDERRGSQKPEFHPRSS